MTKEIIEKYIQFAIDSWMKFLVKEKIWLYPNEYHTFFVKTDNFIFVNDFKIKVSYNKAIINRDVEYTYNDIIWTDYINIIELITSKEFIEAVTRWIIRQRFSKNALEENIQNAFNSSVFKGKIIEITHNQADAIRDWKLEEFILLIIK